MLNLSEEWKKAYTSYIKEQDSKFNENLDDCFDELAEANESIKKGFDLLAEYYNLYALSEGVNLSEVLYPHPGVPANTTAVTDKDGNIISINKPTDAAKPMVASQPKPSNSGTSSGVNYNYSTTSRDTFNAPKFSSNLVASLSQLVDGLPDKGSNYAPVATYTVQTVGDMKFPENVIFFLGQIIKWIKNIVLYFIVKFTNMLKRLARMPDKQVDIDPSALKLDLTRAKKIEQVATQVKVGRDDGIVKLWSVKPEELNRVGLEESLLDLVTAAGFKGNNTSPAKSGDIDASKKPIIISLDFSKDLLSLRELMQHFYDLYDNAYGSNNEKLFDTSDLEAILRVFQTTIKKIKNGDAPMTYSMGGYATEVSAIDSSKVKDNLILTNANINNLKQAYVITADKIKNISQIINSKEMMALADYSFDYKMLTAGTLNQLQGIVDTIPSRLKDAEKLSKQLSKMGNQYSKLIKELEKMQLAVTSLSPITYDSVTNRRMLDLLNSAKYMSDVVTVRLTGLGLYIRELKDIRGVISMMAAINGHSKR